MKTSKPLGMAGRGVVTWIATILIVAGLLLTTVHWGFLAMVATGAIGPALLRECRWLDDRDEWQLQSSYRAGLHAYIATVIMSTFLVIRLRLEGSSISRPDSLALVFLVLPCFTWTVSSLMSYWGTFKAVWRIQISFGLAWLVFTILSNTGSEWTGWKNLGLHTILALPFFFSAWLSTRWPRVTGVLLLAAAIFFGYFFGSFDFDLQKLIDRSFVLILFIGPLFASGVALLTSDLQDADDAT